MAALNLRRLIVDFIEKESLLPDLKRAVRATIAFMVPLLATSFGWLHMDPVHACIAANTIALVDVRGAYSLRLGLLLAVSLILTAAVFLGSLGAINLPMALVGTAIVVAGGGVWRHLSADYGPGLAVSSGLLYFLSLADPAQLAPSAVHPVFATLAGGLFGVLLQVSLWPFHPQHPLRLAVAESWVALADLLARMSPETSSPAQTVTDLEVDLRATLNRSQATLHASKRHSGDLLRELELLNIAAARLALRVIAFRTAMETMADRPGFKQLEPVVAPALQSLTNTARMVALAVVSRQPSHLAAFEVRVKRLENLLSVLRAQVECQLDDSIASGQFSDIIRQIEEQLPIVRDALRKTMDRANERGAFSLELFDLGTLTLRPLAVSLNLSWKVEPALVRHTARAIFISMIGVLIYKLSGIPHGYWLPFTMLIVLQPDFGSTREKAAQRVLGTLIGGSIASSLLWLHPPHAVVLAAITITIALFAYFQKRNYGLAVIFITLMVVLLTESQHPVTLAFTLERMGSTLGGGMLALGAALIFWPAWEKDRFPAIMAKALGANLHYLKLTLEYLHHGNRYDEPLMQAGQTAESSNSDAFSSLRRMIGDPKNQQDGLQLAAALANGNQRITQALSVIVLHLNDQQTRHPETIKLFKQIAGDAFALLEEAEKSGTAPPAIHDVRVALENFRLPEIQADHQDPDRFREPWVFPQLGRIVTELSAMIRITAPSKE